MVYVLSDATLAFDRFSYQIHPGWVRDCVVLGTYWVGQVMISVGAGDVMEGRGSILWTVGVFREKMVVVEEEGGPSSSSTIV